MYTYNNHAFLGREHNIAIKSIPLVRFYKEYSLWTFCVQYRNFSTKITTYMYESNISIYIDNLCYLPRCAYATITRLYMDQQIRGHMWNIKCDAVQENNPLWDTSFSTDEIQWCDKDRTTYTGKAVEQLENLVTDSLIIERTYWNNYSTKMMRLLLKWWLQAIAYAVIS